MNNAKRFYFAGKIAQQLLMVVIDGKDIHFEGKQRNSVSEVGESQKSRLNRAIFKT